MTEELLTEEPLSEGVFRLHAKRHITALGELRSTPLVNKAKRRGQGQAFTPYVKAKLALDNYLNKSTTTSSTLLRNARALSDAIDGCLRLRRDGDALDAHWNVLAAEGRNLASSIARYERWLALSTEHSPPAAVGQPSIAPPAQQAGIQYAPGTSTARPPSSTVLAPPPPQRAQPRDSSQRGPPALYPQRPLRSIRTITLRLGVGHLRQRSHTRQPAPLATQALSNCHRARSSPSCSRPLNNFPFRSHWTTMLSRPCPTLATLRVISRTWRPDLPIKVCRNYNSYRHQARRP